MSSRSDGGRAGVLRGVSAPVRRYLNNHFAMVRSDITETRAQLLAGGADIGSTRAVVMASAERLEESAFFLGMQLGRLGERVDEVHGAMTRLAPAAGDVTWCAFAARSLAARPGAVVATDDAVVAAVLAAFGHRCVPTGEVASADAAALRRPTAEALASVRAALPAGALLLWTAGSDGDGADTGVEGVERLVLADGSVLGCATV